jgi:N4-gp56 family major capsid protein
MATNIPYGSPQAIILQSAGLFAANMQRNTTLNRLTGKFPQQGDAEANIRQQSSNKMPIVKCMDLTKMAGDEVTFDLVNPMGGTPIMGGEMAEGRGRSMSFSQDRLRINQARYPISAGDTMSQQRTPHELRSLARALGQDYMDRLGDQQILVHMAGARGFHDNIEWCVPKANDANFAKVMVNTVKAPTKNRHFMSTGSGIEPFAAAGNVVSLATTDVMNADVVDGLRTFLDSMPLPPPPVIFEGDKMASDAPVRVLLVSSEQYTSFVQSTGFRSLQANAMARAQNAGNNPLFMGEAGLWNGILIVKMPKPIRFYAGNEIKHCASNTSETETTGDLVNGNFGTGYAVDRAILLGGQALAEAWGKNRNSGAPFFWSEKELDHGDKLELLIGTINGRSKIRFLIDHGDAQQYTDYGVMVIDTAVKIAGQ